MQPRTIAVMLSGLGKGVLTITSPTNFVLQYGSPRRKERYFSCSAEKLDAFLHGQAALHVWVEGRTVRIGSYIRGN
jgi:hypothetical protein